MNDNGETVTVIDGEYAKHQIEHIRNLVNMVEGRISHIEGQSAELVEKNIDHSIDALKEEVDNLKHRYSFYYREDK